jgi:hypothetical protein
MRLAFVQLPGSSPAGQPITPPVTVQLEDASGSPVAQGGVTITLSLSSGTGMLGGTLSRVTDASGRASFGDLSISLAGSKQLTATSAGRVAAVSSPFTIAGGSQTSQTFVLSDESGRFVTELAGGGYAGYNLVQVLLAIRQTAVPDVSGIVTDPFLAALAACPSASQIVATRVGDLPAGGSVAISTDCTAQLVDLRGAAFSNQPGTATLAAAIPGVGVGLFTTSSAAHAPLVSWQAGGTTYQTLGIAWALKRVSLRRVLPGRLITGD